MKEALKESAWSIFLRELAVLGLLVGIIYYCFITGFYNEFTFDDHLAIDGNHDVIGKSYDSYLWFHDIWGKDLVEIDSHKSYRPLLIVIFHYLWNYENKAYIFRSASIVAHFLTSYMMYHLTQHIYRENDGKFLIALASALFFAAHPVHVESVTAVVNLAEPLSALFIIFAYLLFQRIHKNLLDSKGSNITVTLQVIFWIVIVVTAILLKETGIIALLLCLAYTLVSSFYLLVYHYVFTRNLKKTIGKDPPSKQLQITLSDRKGRIVFAGFSLVFLNAALIYTYFVMREIITSHDRLRILKNPQELVYFFFTFLFKNNGATSYLNSSALIRRAENPFAFIKGAERILSFLYLYFRYFALLVYPNEQSPEYSYNCIPTVKDFDDPRNHWSYLLITTTVLLILVGLYQFFRNLLNQARLTHDRLSEEWTEALSAKTNEKIFDYVSSYRDDNDGTNENKEQKEKDKNENAESGARSNVEKSGGVKEAIAIAVKRIEKPSFEVIETLFWILIPFIPLTGVIFTLGTLLAERLLYLCSIGFCILLAASLYSLIVLITGKTKQRKASWFLFMIYSTIVIALISYYTNQTRLYNLAWKNDDSLFFHAQKVCPNSSKINLQVAKIYINHKNFYKAMKMVEKAKSIDPEFCDIEYTEALILLSQATEEAASVSTSSHSSSSNLFSDYEEKLEKAMHLCLKNLQCVFTNKLSYKLLQDFWSHQISYVDNKLQSLEQYNQNQQLQQKKNNNNQKPYQVNYQYEIEYEKAVDEKIDLFEKQAVLAGENNLTMITIQRYTDISVFAYEKKRLKKVFTFLKRAHDAMDRLLQEYHLSWTNDDSDDDAVASLSSRKSVMELSDTMITNIRFLQCRIAALGGTLRSSVLRLSKADGGNEEYEEIVRKLPKKAFTNTTIFTFLKNATAPVCLKSILPVSSSQLLLEQVSRKTHYLESLMEDKGWRTNSVFLEHIQMSNAHFLQLIGEKFFTYDFFSLFSSIQTVIFRDEEERVAEELLRQLSLGMLLEMVQKEWKLRENMLNKAEKKMKEFMKKNDDNNRNTTKAEISNSLITIMNERDEELEEQWDKIDEALREVKDMSFFDEKGLTSTGNRQKKRRQMNNNHVLLQLLQVWNLLGSRAYADRDFSRAASYFGLLISFYHAVHHRNMELFFHAFISFTSKSLKLNDRVQVANDGVTGQSAEIVNTLLLSEHGKVWKKSANKLLFESFRAKPLKKDSIVNSEVKSEKKKQKEEIIKSPVFAHWVYYYADSLVGIPGFYERSDGVWLVTKLLDHYAKIIRQMQKEEKKSNDEATPSPDVKVIHGLVEKFRNIYCQMTDIESQDYELCAFS